MFFRTLGMRFFRFTLVLFLLGSSFFFFAGCSKTSRLEKIHLAVWGTPEELKIITDTIDAWEKRAQPDFKVEIEHIPWDSYMSKLETEIAGDTAPDVIACESTFFPNFVKRDVLEPLTQYVAADKNFNINKYYKTIVDNFSYNGQLYVIPRDISAVACVYYNKALFQQAGLAFPKDDWDYTEFVDTAKKLTRRAPDGTVQVYGFLTGFWDNFIYNAGGHFVDNEAHPTKSAIGRREFKEGLQFYYDLSYKYKVSPDFKALNKLDSGEVELFKMGRVAMLGSGIWLAPTLRLDDNLDWDIAMWPQSKKGKGIATEIGGTGYAILKSSKNKQKAWELVKVLAGDEGQKILAKTGLAVPANRIIAEGPAWKLDTTSKPKNKAMLNKALKYNNVYYPFLASWTEIQEKYIDPEIDKLMNGMEPIDVVIRKMDENVDKAIKKEHSK